MNNATISSSHLNETLEKNECFQIDSQLRKLQKSLNETNYAIGMPLAFVQAFTIGSAQIVIRRLAVKKVHFSVVNLFASFIGKI